MTSADTSPSATLIPADISNQDAQKPVYTIRPFRVGELGYIVYRQGTLYDEQHQWGIRFEGVVARIVADFIDNYDSSKEGCWIVERLSDGAFLGSVMLVKDRESGDPLTAKLRLLCVEPQCRGFGIGRALVRQCMEFSKTAGYKKIVLWTQSVLLPARKIYEREGYKLLRTEEHSSFGVPLTGEYWGLTL